MKEVGVSLEEKTIKPINKGGILGGEKCIFLFFFLFFFFTFFFFYFFFLPFLLVVVGNILFKFAIDKSDMFGGDQSAAQKVAGHEIKCKIDLLN